MFLWPVTSPFYMLHVDIWVPGNYRNYKGNQYLLTAMCNLTGFIIATAVTSTKSQVLTVAFFQEVLLKVGMCGVVILDASSAYLSEFTAMCSTLQVRLHPASREILEPSVLNASFATSTKPSPSPKTPAIP